MSGVVGVLAAAAEVEAFCRSRNWRFCFIGGIAVQRWGDPRFTQDVDVTLLTGLGSEESFVDALLSRFSGRHADSRQFALDQRVLLARSSHGVDLDIALGAFPFESISIEHASPWSLNDQVSLTTCSAEDLIIHKAFASRDRDWGDVEGILSRQHGQLDIAYIRKELPMLLELKDDAPSMEKLERLISMVEYRMGS